MRRAQILLAALGVFAVALVASMALAPTEPHMQDDAVSHLLRVKDCLLGNGCYLRLGPFSGQSVVGVSHGAAILHLLTLVWGLGGGAAQWYLLAAVTHALGAMLLFLLTMRWLRPGILPALAITLLCHQGSMAWVLPETISNPALLPLPSALLCAAAYGYLQSHKLRHLLAAALAVGLGIQLHLTFLFHVPTLLLLVLLARPPRRLRHLALALGTILASIALVSPAMLQDVQPSLAFLTSGGGRDHLLQGRLGPPLLLATAGLLAAGLLLLQRRRTGQVDRFFLLLLLGFVPIQVVLLALAPPGQAYYNAPFIGGSLLLCAALPLLALDHFAPVGWRALRQNGLPWKPLRLAHLLAWLLLLVLVLQGQVRALRQRGEHGSASDSLAAEHLPMRAAAGLAQHFGAAQHWTVADFLRHLRGASGDVGELLGAIAYYLPGQRAVPTRTAAQQDIVPVRVAARDVPQTLPPGWLELNRTAQSSVLTLAYAPWLDWDHYLVCRRQRAEAHPCQWRQADYQRRVVKIHPDDQTLWAAQRQFTLEVFTAEQGCALFGVRVPLRVPANAAPRTLLLPGLGFDSRTCTAEIAAVAGVAHRGGLPARSVELLPGAVEQVGEVLLVLDSCVPTQRISPLYRPPALIELDAPSRDLFAKAAGTKAAAMPVLPERELQAFAGGTVVAMQRQPVGDAEREPTAPLWYALALAVGMVLALGTAAGCVACTLAGTGAGTRAGARTRAGTGTGTGAGTGAGAGSG